MGMKNEAPSTSTTGSAEWRASELKRRVENRRLAAQSLLAGGDNSAWYASPAPSLRTSSSASLLSSHLSPHTLKPSAKSPSSSSLLSSSEVPLSISIPGSSPLRSKEPLSTSQSRFTNGSTQMLVSTAVSLPHIWNTRQEVLDVHLDVVDMQAKQAASIRACDQQFRVEKNVRQLKSGISAAQLSIRQKKDELDALQSRVLRLSKTLHDTSGDKNFAKNKLLQLDEIRKQCNGMKRCSVCAKEFLPRVLIVHEASCINRSDQLAGTTSLLASMSSVNQLTDQVREVRRNSTSSVTVALAPKLPHFVSQPPRNLRVVLDRDSSVTHSAILLQWDPPIFTGSTPIIDYELHFSFVQSVTKRQLVDAIQRMTTVRELQPFPPQVTSRWCLQEPVAQKEYWVRDLVADQEYGDFAICAVTKNGKSELSNKVELVKTAPAVPPTKPHFLRAGAITAKTISLGWHEPLDDGGAAIEFYEIVFSEATMQETIADTKTDKKNFLDVSEVVYKPRRVRTTSNATTFMITELLSGKEHKDFHVRAVNRAGIPGEFSDAVASIFTVAPGNEFKLLDELQAAVNSRAKVVDSQFLSGFMQRYERNHYIFQVSRFIVSMHPEMEAKVNSILSRTDLSLSDEEDGGGVDEDSAQDDNAKPRVAKKRFEDLSEDEQIQERRRQFHFRISDLNTRLKSAEYNVQWSKDRRVDLVALIRTAENRILGKQAELERAKMFTGPQMDSDVLENGLQRFYTKDLIFALEDEIGIEQLYIIDAKSEIIKVENYLRGDIKKRDIILERLQDRKDALALFEMNPRGSPEDGGNSSSRCQESVKMASLARIRKGVLFRTFSAFVKNRSAAIEKRNKVRATLTRFLNYRCRVAFQHWLWLVRNVLRQSGSGTADGVYGVGSIGLVNAALDRDDLMLQSQELLQQLRTTDGSLKSLVWTKEQQSEQQHLTSRRATGDRKQVYEREKYYPFMLEADVKMDIEDYAGAFRLYDFILSNTKWMDKMAHSEILQLQFKLGRASFRLKNYEQALIFLNRASFLAVRLGLRAEEGAISLLLAQVQFTLHSLRRSIESYEHALLCFEAAGDKKGQVACFRGLQCVYTKLEDKEMVQHNKEQADEIEFVLTNKLTSAGQVLDNLQKRLVGVGAESSTEITLERVGAIVPQLRTQRIQRKLDISEEKKLVSSLEKLLTEKKALLAQGEADLKRALASDTSQVDSMVLSGTSARYEIEDFKKKLAKLMGSIKAGEERILKEIANARIRISNSEDEIHELEQELGVETGNLMCQIMGKDKLRCFRFSATNESLKCVVGTASHGVTTCVATSELTGFLFDLLTGTCLGQAVGDLLRQHLGPPRGHQTQIVALYYVGNRIYTGGMDAALGVWEVQEDGGGSAVCVTLVKMMQEFDAAVVSVVADNQLIVCGCSDCDVFVFDTNSLVLVTRVIAAHERSVVSVAIDSAMNWFTTGGADNRIKVWELGPVSSQTAYRKATLRYCLEPERRGDEFFNGHLHPVTCLKQVSSEIVSGDSNGRVIIWNLDAGDNDSDSKLLRICDVHQNVPVLCLQFDATRIVSGAQDGDICVTDFATGHLIQTLHGHKASVLDLQFDRKRLMSMSADGKMRLWYWQGRIGVNSAADRKKYHILGSGETLKALSLKYRTSINELLKWNGLPDSSKLYLGQKLVVGIDENNSVAADELKSLDTAVSTIFGKASHENLSFVAANKAKSVNVEAQWASRKLALLAKEYFPPIDDESESKSKEEDEKEEDESSDSDSDMPIEEEATAEGDGDHKEEEDDDKASK